MRVILRNPRYTGRQVWNKQRKDEIVLDVDDVAVGYETRMRWNDTSSWVWSDSIGHELLISNEDFDAAQAIMADGGAQPAQPRVTSNRYPMGYHRHWLNAEEMAHADRRGGRGPRA